MSARAYLFRQLYSTILILSLPLLLIRGIWRNRQNRDYRTRLGERFGFFSGSRPKPGGIWLHAVSVGESIAATPLIQAFQTTFPHLDITITTTTPTGSARIQTQWGNSISHSYLPFDITLFHSWFLSRVQPAICIIMETELWPNLLSLLKSQNIPVLIANARISPRSFKGYHRMQSITKLPESMMRCLSKVAAQSLEDGERFLALGLSQAQLEIVGNIKFDQKLETDIENRALALKAQWGEKRPVWIAASTHPGEEEIIINTYHALRNRYPDLLLILAPRHVHRTHEVQTLLRQNLISNSYCVRSRQLGDPIDPSTDILLLDTLGELLLFYSASDLAFVGGSLVPHGGHNTLEPALCGIPSIVGPHVENFLEITRKLQAVSSLLQVHDAKALEQAVDQWLAAPHERKAAGERGRKVVLENRGAVTKIVATGCIFLNSTLD